MEGKSDRATLPSFLPEQVELFKREKANTACHD